MGQRVGTHTRYWTEFHTRDGWQETNSLSIRTNAPLCGPQRTGVAIADTFPVSDAKPLWRPAATRPSPRSWPTRDRYYPTEGRKSKSTPARDSTPGWDAWGTEALPLRTGAGWRSIADTIPRRFVCRPSLIGPTRRPAWRWTRTSRRGPRPRLRPRSAKRLVRARRGGSRLARACHERRGRCHDGTQTIGQWRAHDGDGKFRVAPFRPPFSAGRRARAGRTWRAARSQRRAGRPTCTPTPPIVRRRKRTLARR